ncbi:MAG: DUF3299 domain-containing protein [Pseudomonadota bacterium]
MRTLQSVVALISALVLLVTASQALAARDLKWPDLLPKLPPIKDPLATLNAEERIELETILWVRQLTEAERAERKEIVQEAGRYEQKFRQKGIIIDRLVENYAVFDKKLTARQRKVNAKLSGETVRLTGYLLPLEFSEDGETEFLLVPYVGACIHVPPPPPNQIVLVTLSAKYKANEVFTPVRVTGKLATKAASKRLYLVDGAADISVGYHLSDGAIEIVR